MLESQAKEKRKTSIGLSFSLSNLVLKKRLTPLTKNALT